MGDVAKCRREMARLETEFAKFKQQMKKLRAEFKKRVAMLETNRAERVHFMEERLICEDARLRVADERRSSEASREAKRIKIREAIWRK